MRRIALAALSVSLALLAAACSDNNPSAPDDASSNPPPAGIVISNALASSSNANSIGAIISLSVSASSIAYLSAAPATFPGATSVVLRNETIGGSSQSVQVIDGGFDPVGIQAKTGDELSLKISISGGEPAVNSVKVPARRQPGVVRTNPAKGRTDVALNVRLLVVFSEPVDTSSVTRSSITLLKDGSAVPGRVEVAADALSAEFVPDIALQPETTYSLIVDSGIRDLDGDALDFPAVVPFTTSTALKGFGLITGIVLDAHTQGPLSAPLPPLLRVLASPSSNPNQNEPFVRLYDSSNGRFSSNLLAAGTWSITFSFLHPWTVVFPGLHLYADTTVVVEVVAGKTTVMPDLLVRRRPPLLLIGVETCPWPLPDPPTASDWGDCDGGYWGGAEVQIKVNGVAGTKTAGVYYEATIGTAQVTGTQAFWYATSWSTYFDISIPGDYDVSLVGVAPSSSGKAWLLVPWLTPTTRVSVDQGLGYVEFEFWHK